MDVVWLVCLRRTVSTNREVPYPLTEPANRPVGLITGKREFGKNSKKALTVPTSTRTLRLHFVAGWSSLVARQAHNLKVAGSNPAPAPNLREMPPPLRGGISVSEGLCIAFTFFRIRRVVRTSACPRASPDVLPSTTPASVSGPAIGYLGYSTGRVGLWAYQHRRDANGSARCAELSGVAD